MSQGTTIRRTVLACLVLWGAACGREDGEEGYGSVSVLMTDAPDPRIDSAVVTIAQVYLQGEERVVLRREPITVDLLSLSNSAMALVESAVVPIDETAELRFVIEGAYIVVSDDLGDTRIFATPDYAQVPTGRTIDGVLRTPSADTSGFKVQLPASVTLAEGEQRVLLVDFDVAESFGHEAGSSGAWVMRPVLRANDLKATSSVEVRVRVPEPDSVRLIAVGGDLRARLLDDGNNFEGELVLTDEDADGTFIGTFKFVDPSEGPFSVAIVGHEDLSFITDPNVQTALEVPSGTTAGVTFTLTAASPR